MIILYKLYVISVRLMYLHGFNFRYGGSGQSLFGELIVAKRRKIVIYVHVYKEIKVIVLQYF